MALVISVVSFIVSQAFNNRQFKTVLDKEENDYYGLLLHSDVH